MKHRATLSIVLSILVPVFLLAILSQSMAQAAESQDLLESVKPVEQAGGEIAPAVVLAPLVDEADLGISKSGSPDIVIAGELLTYTLTISNSGLVSATNVVVTDTLPVSLTVANVSTSLGEVCSESPPIVCQLGTMEVAATVWLTIETTVDTDASGILHNMAQVGSDATESNTINNTYLLDTTVNGSADLAITKSDEPDPTSAGGNVTFTLTILNNGPSDAVDVVVTDTLPISTTLVEATPSQGPSCTEGDTVTCNLGPLSVGNEATVIIEVFVDEAFAGLLQNDAEVSSSTPDPESGNNATSEDTAVDPIVDLSISKSSDPETAIAGEDLTYHLMVTNNGLFPATNVLVTDTLPVATSIITATASQGSGCSLGNVVTCTLGTLAAGASAPITIEVTVDSSALGTLDNRAETSTDTPESDDTNNDAEISTTVNTSVDLSIGKVADPDPAVAGGLLTYNIVINNEGPSDAAEVTITDTLPLSTTFVSASVVQGATIIHTIDTSI